MKNYWYPACPSSQLKNEPYATQVLEHKLVLFRDADGKPHALMDRCCHRGFPLSRGKMMEGNLMCGYHGWEYNGSGQCVKIPSQPSEKSIPKTYCIPSFSCEEKDGYVWVWPGEESKKTPPPSIPEFSQSKWMQGSRVIQCNYKRALEITFDAPHVYIVHPTHPATVAAKKHGIMFSEQELRVTETGCLTFAPATQNDSDPIPQHAFRMEFSLPGQIRFEMPAMFQGAYMIFFTTPLTQDSCRMDWLIANLGYVDTPEHVLWTGEGRDVIQEDQYVLELVQKAYAEEGEAFERSVEADIPTLTVRKIVKLAETGEWPASAASIPKRRTFTMVGPAGF